MESLFKRAKAFIGLEEEGEGEGEELISTPQSSRQLEIASVLRGKKEGKRAALPEGESDIVVYEPKVYEDSLNISANLRGGSPVIINLKHLEPTEGTRLIDFVCGTAYAIDGHMMKIGDSIFLFAPKQINIIDAEEKSNLGEEIGAVESKRESFFTRR
ncbi:cell division protein SepF [Candidatus Saganbacteria bacterium]|nr:cell division protein SepF [Candidatus Saganbacteria bacterium]